MKKCILPLMAGLFNLVLNVQAQDDESAPSLLFSGSVDTYYKYDFSGKSQIPTSFAGAQNSIGIGMVNLVFEQAVGNFSFVGEVAFGPRAENSAPGPVQNLYVGYQATDKISFTGGFMATYIGYEVISPTGNFNYSTSYLFSNGPFQQAGVKMDYVVTDRFAFMVGAFNNFDSYTNTQGGMDFGLQLYFMPVDRWDLYINLVTSNDTGTETDITTTYQATDKLLIGFNAAQRTRGNLYNSEEGDGVNFGGAALYVDFAFNDVVAVGFRGEYFSDKDGSIFQVPDPADTGNYLKTEVIALTLSANIGSGPLTFIPEIRVDLASQNAFEDSKGDPADIAGQILLAAYYAF